MLGAKWYRVYVNSFVDENKLWSVDEGTSETEKQCFKVILASEKPVASGTFIAAHPTREARAWLSVYGVLREITDARGRVVITITRR